MRIVHASAELTPWSKTGGLADVAHALPAAQAALGHEVAVFSPLYRQAKQAIGAAGLALVDSGVSVEFDFRGSIVAGRILRLDDGAPLKTCFVDMPALFDREGLYTNSQGVPFIDNPLRFAFLSRALLDAAPRILSGRPDIVHAHDWHTGLLPYYLHAAPGRSAGACSVLTIHAIVYQGVFPKRWLPAVNVDWAQFHMGAFEYFDRISFLKGAVAFADAVTTVSRTYAREILRPEHAFGLDEFIRFHAQRLCGIRNGLDLLEWDPQTDPAIAARFSATDLSPKKQCRAALLNEVGLDADSGEAVLAVVSRLDPVKGLDLLAAVSDRLAGLGVRLIVLGSGDAALERDFVDLARRHPRLIATHIGFDMALSHRIIAGADMLVVPSRSEPCGLTQMQAMRYGTIPIARNVGGLRDTINDPGRNRNFDTEGTGFVFHDASSEALWQALVRAVHVFRDNRARWEAIMRRAMGQEWSWTTSAEEYIGLYEELLG